MWKFEYFDVKWTINDKKNENYGIFFKIKISYIRKVSMHIIFTFLIFDGELFCNFYFNITMKKKLNPRFSFYLFNKCNQSPLWIIHCQFDMKLWIHNGLFMTFDYSFIMDYAYHRSILFYFIF
jgi:hypothetical protein